MFHNECNVQYIVLFKNLFLRNYYSTLELYSSSQLDPNYCFLTKMMNKPFPKFKYESQLHFIGFYFSMFLKKEKEKRLTEPKLNFLTITLTVTHKIKKKQKKTHLLQPFILFKRIANIF